MESRVSLQPAYVLHSRPFQNTSMMVDFFTLDYGLVRAVAKGARREKSRFRALLQSFQPLLASFSGRSEVKTLTGLECNLSPLQLSGPRLFSALYMNELLSRLLHNQEEHKALYRHYQEALLGLQGQRQIEPVLRQFELRLLAELGYAINLNEDCHSHQPIDASSCYRFTPDVGFELSAEPGVKDQAVNEYLGEHLIALNQLQLEDQAVANSAKRLLRQALSAHLGDKPLHSRQLFN